MIPDYLDKIFVGTPFKNILSRLLGVRLGKRVFDDGCFIPERTLATIGDDCTLNAHSVIQCHSQEDGSIIGAVLAPDSFLMKGEEIPQHARWGGNPAREVRSYQAGSATEPVPAQPVAHHAPSHM